MWHEARKQERKIRGLIVDYRKRAERRQYFYDKIQADPTQFLQLHGRRSKIYLDPAVAAAGDGAAIIVPWQGQQDNLIDRFDVRAHLDHIPPVGKGGEGGDADTDMTAEERQLNYERYRILAQNDFLNVSEDKFLHQLYLEEQFGANAQLEAERNLAKKKQKTGGATIGYSYEDAGDAGAATIGPQPFGHSMNAPAAGAIGTGTAGGGDKGEGSDESDSDIDMDVSIDIGKLDTAQAHELNACGRNYGMKSNDFFSHLTKDADEADALRIAREEEQEKMLLSGRKSRRERRAQKERRIANRPFSPPSYAAKEDKKGGKNEKDEESDSRSPSPAEAGPEKITYITSFGGEDEMQPHSKITINLSKPGPTLGESCINASTGAAIASSGAGGSVSYAQKVKDNLDKLKLMNETTKRSGRRRTRSHSRSRSASGSRSRSGSRRRNRRSRSYRRRSRTRSRRRRRYYSRSRSRSRSRTRSRSRSGSWKRYKSRSTSYKRSRKRYSYSSRSSSASSFEAGRRRRSRSRSRSHSDRRSRTKKKTSPSPAPPAAGGGYCLSTTTTTTTTSTLTAVKLLQQQQQQPRAPPPPMISYPLPMRVLGLTTTTPAAPAVPVPALPQVVEAPPPPLKRYYGRKRANDTSSSSSTGGGDNSEASDNEEQLQPAASNKPQADDSDEMEADTASERSHALHHPAMSSTCSTGNQTGKYSSATETKVRTFWAWTVGQQQWRWQRKTQSARAS
ncbi:CLK4-associating serine/arginine rich protein isoform X2 [Drosophila subobscura]|uniref:CLK4-associating serine/arginine rich protein isoform X2 n=1 Tax=Drosophila subobscura TaxID=7241 RepID=UPI00155A7F4C|nr:CLK4-associating serine/arginine rich protein isoform X2 [Drosophila subobscura]